MTWCSHRKGVNEGLSAAAALSKQMCGCRSHLPSPLPPPFHSVRLVVVGVRQENAALCVGVCVGGWGWG